MIIIAEILIRKFPVVQKESGNSVTSSWVLESLSSDFSVAVPNKPMLLAGDLHKISTDLKNQNFAHTTQCPEWKQACNKYICKKSAGHFAALLTILLGFSFFMNSKLHSYVDELASPYGFV